MRLGSLYIFKAFVVHSYRDFSSSSNGGHICLAPLCLSMHGRQGQVRALVREKAAKLQDGFAILPGKHQSMHRGGTDQPLRLNASHWSPPSSTTA